MTNIPNNNKRKPTKKKNFSLDDFKKKTGSENVGMKPLEWFKCSSALRTATGLPGFPKGYVSLSRGFSNTGKSTSVCEAAVSAQKAGCLPIIIDTENNLGRDRLELMGFDWDGNYIFIDNEYLLEKFGKPKDKNRSEAAIEDMAECVTYFLNLQDNGELPFDLVFIIDSLGTLDCVKSINAYDKGTTDNNMWNAGAFERSFKYLLNNRIPNSRKKDKEFTNTLIAVQKIWLDSMAMGMPVVKHKGGEAFFFGARLIFHHGGVQTHGTTRKKATSKKRDIVFGIETKVSIIKNQIDSEGIGGVAMEGKVISTPHGFIGVEKEDIDEYKKKNILYFRESLGADDDGVLTDIDPNEIIIEDDDVDNSFDINNLGG